MRGQRLDTVTEIRVQEPKSTGKVLGKGRKVGVGNQQSAEVVGDSEIDVEVTVPPEVAGGLLGISLINPGGEGKPCMVAINDDTSLEREADVMGAQATTGLGGGALSYPQHVDTAERASISLPSSKAQGPDHHPRRRTAGPS